MFVHKIIKNQAGEAEASASADYSDFENMTASIVSGSRLYMATDSSQGDIKWIDLTEPFPSFGNAQSIKFLNDGTGAGYRVIQLDIIQNKLLIVSQNQLTGTYYLHRADMDFSNPVEIRQSNGYIRIGTA
jgi:hypothetical protein